VLFGGADVLRGIPAAQLADDERADAGDDHDGREDDEELRVYPSSCHLETLPGGGVAPADATLGARERRHVRCPRQCSRPRRRL
jgi:hypothetical protein